MTERMEELKRTCELVSCEKLKKIILENPELPVLLYGGEQVGDYEFELVDGAKVYAEIEQVCLQNNKLRPLAFVIDDIAEELDIMLEEQDIEYTEEEFEEWLTAMTSKIQTVNAITICIA